MRKAEGNIVVVSMGRRFLKEDRRSNMIEVGGWKRARLNFERALESLFLDFDITFYHILILLLTTIFIFLSIFFYFPLIVIFQKKSLECNV